MILFIIRRLIEALPVALFSTMVVFSMIHLLPGDAAQAIAGADATPEVVEAVRKAYGLDQPLPVQYVQWLGNVLHGDLGVSIITRVPVTDIIGRRWPATLELAVAGVLLAWIVAFPLGIAAALNARKKIDVAITFYNGLALSVPGFWLGLLAILLFALVLGWLPPGGRVEFTRDPLLALKSLLLPAVTVALPTTAGLGRLIRTSMLEVLGEDYVRTARAKGLAQSAVVIRHGLRNALIPVVTVMALQFGRQLGGQVIIESVFTWPGMGRLIVDSISTRDYAVVQGALLLFVGVYVAINLVADMSYALIDPRIRLGARRRR